MYIVIVKIHVKQDIVDKFVEATILNAQNSIQEPGIVKFDFLQQQNDPTKFILYEVYRTQADTLVHKDTHHYKEWRERVAMMMIEERTSEKYHNIFPDEINWE